METLTFTAGPRPQREFQRSNPIFILTSKLLHTPFQKSTFVSMVSDVLPQKNEEYGTKEYW